MFVSQLKKSVIAVFLTFFLSGCLTSDRDIALDVGPAAPAQVGTYIDVTDPSSSFKISYDKGIYVQEKDGKISGRYRFFKTPESDKLHILQSIGDKSYTYYFAAVFSDVIVVGTATVKGDQKVPNDFIGHVEHSAVGYVIKNPTITYPFLRRILKDDPSLSIAAVYKRV